MKEENKIERYYQMRAKQIIDTMFETKIFHEKITRDDMNGFEDLIAFLLQSDAGTAKKCAEFSVKYKNKL